MHGPPGRGTESMLGSSASRSDTSSGFQGGRPPATPPPQCACDECIAIANACASRRNRQVSPVQRGLERCTPIVTLVPCSLGLATSETMGKTFIFTSGAVATISSYKARVPGARWRCS